MARFIQGFVYHFNIFQNISVGPDFYPQIYASEQAIKKMTRKFRSFRDPLNESLRSIVIPSIRRNFEVGGRPKWKPLSPSTVRQRGSSRPILIRSGTLQKKATQINIWRVEATKMYVDGLDKRVKYAAYHQGGTRLMPARVFMLYQNEDIAGIEMIFDRWIGKVVQQNW